MTITDYSDCRTHAACRVKVGKGAEWVNLKRVGCAGIHRSGIETARSRRALSAGQSPA